MIERLFSEWYFFKTVFEKEISPIYHLNEQKFDSKGIHGIRHIIRSLIFSEVLINFYQCHVKSDLNLERIRIAISFHDSGRKSNGPDFWENESAEKCYSFLKKFGYSDSYAISLSDPIKKNKGFPNKNESIIEQQIINDVDVLEILRLYLGFENPTEFLQLEELSFLSNYQTSSPEFFEKWLTIRHCFIFEALQFIQETEDLELGFDSENVFDLFVGILRSKPRIYKLLNKWFPWDLNKNGN
jgi:hypothetical protein